ncbi:hypothetical protein [Clostridium sp. AWRP]|uniref:hypothetical protein n=1 Tax=Clostridium sp. AWRP TaxID=2212991 RepID=UPI000FDAD11C|nr:hypothetical protein [Clostridium sp. AWRP]AZV56766.1 hypothetical protein DMR38_09225 [Clostridium sp. AWRP]
MDRNILFLAKFSELSNLKKLKNGNMYFSNAENFRKIEEEQFIRGQGDKYDGMFNIFTVSAKFIPNKSTDNEYVVNNIPFSIDFEGNKNKAVFCIMAGTKENCIEYEGKNHYKIKFNKEQSNLIKNHFRNADSVLIIKNPLAFIENIHTNIKNHICDNKVFYYKNNRLTDKFINFIFQTNFNNIGKREMSINQNNVHRFLLCKDEFFKLQQEYRFILYDTFIDEPRTFFINPIDDCEIYTLDDFFAGIEVNMK